jgi:tryptophanyl-tRNA synthetase
MTEFSEKSYGTFKTLVAEKTMEHLAPIRQKIKELLEEKQELDSLLKKGAGLAQEKAQKTLQAVSDCIGLTRRH